MGTSPRKVGAVERLLAGYGFNYIGTDNALREAGIKAAIGRLARSFLAFERNESLGCPSVQ